jgi:membrane protease YdiL (CAAX protease family)
MSDEFTPDLESTPYEPELTPVPLSEPALPEAAQAGGEPPALFQSFSQPEIVIPKRIPHLGHLALLGAFLVFGFLVMTVTVLVAVYLQSHSLSNLDRIKTDVHYTLGSMAVLYVVTLALSLIVFPLFWNKGFFAGIHWRAATARRLFWRLVLIASGCIALAMLDDKFLPGPKNAPIDDMFRTPGAAWLMFAFGVTFAPFFEEIAFRGFLLPALATAWDWVAEKITGQPASPLDADGHPEWSTSAMVAASVATSLPFALMHAQQTGWSPGPFVLLVVVSLILCAVRLQTRSLAASTLVHACYNFILFTSALIASGGFRHFDKM